MPTTPKNDVWIREHVQVHADPLRAWLRAKFPRLEDIDNVVQETIARVWRARERAVVGSPQALMFRTAQNLAIDQMRRERIAPMQPLAEVVELSVYEESPTPDERTARNQELELLTKALQSLPDKCRQVLTLRKIYGLSQKETAAFLGISEHTVEAQVGNGMRRCAAYFESLGLPESRDA